MHSTRAASAPGGVVSSENARCRRQFTRIAVCLVFGLITVVTPRLWSQDPAIIDREPEIKAAYLYNFGRYVDWPAGAVGPREFVIGVVGESPIIPPLATIAGTKKVNDRTITIRRFRAEKDFQQCQLLFIPAGQDPKLAAAILKAAANTPTLVVGEDPEFAVQHGHIGFYSAQNNVKFEINHKSAGKAGLKISAKLLNLGRIVGEKPGK